MKLVLIAALCAACLAPAADPAWRFKPARYQGLVLGTSTRAEAWRVLGKPDHSGPLEDSPGVTVDDYRRRPKTSVWMEKGEVVYIQVRHLLPWTREGLTQSFGPGWQMTTCGGRQQFWENRPLGIANPLGSQEIEYLRSPIPNCQPPLPIKQ
ncbi:MAG: hypothetical protein FJW31_03830 [Acidobacteria bacterium]|nr:hypothetical protein [Acidobacteriota bacterium]